MINRRFFLKSSCAGVGLASGFAHNLASLNAYADTDDSYKALVCVFLYGGMDSHDSVIPYDPISFGTFERIRAPLLSQYDKLGVSRRHEHLLRLGGELGGREFGFPLELKPLHDLFVNGNAAIVGNVGPLIEPITRRQFENGGGRRPAKLFSHNDQQSIWMASSPEGAASGWGGRMADAMLSSGINERSSFSALSVAGNSVFLTGNSVQPYVTSVEGPPHLTGSQYKRVLGSEDFNDVYQEVLRSSDLDNENLFVRDIIDITDQSLESNLALETELAMPSVEMTHFSSGSLALQLKMVARIIARRNSLGLKRQVFFVSLGGFDTHADQANKLPGLQTELASSLRSFYDAMVQMGIEQQVTAFTASDFGRTLGVNEDGTDHGWGAHHFVVGGAVRGGRIYGDVPPPEFGHDYDAGRGRLIPSISVDEYAGAFGRWFGLSESDLIEAIPSLQNFDGNSLIDLFR